MGEWVKSSCNSPVPHNAFVAGRDVDGSRIYVGRAAFQGDVLPAKVIPNNRVAYVSHNGSEHRVQYYDVLVGQEYEWVVCGDGLVPANAISPGTTSTLERLYVGRVRHNNSLTIGKVQPSRGCILIPYCHREHSFNSYEVLVKKQRPKLWKSQSY
ncbi:uncharacterized protein Dwil_GK28318 [Drosophila willistoni]|uniref:Uncharacterized protein n=1 Tax=Drosophila willistoni TaxID=7260 RepID=A0A0Q9WNW2_DROWI|nr:uncharacterized protein LOC26530320 [Drosophila willistoni]KRF97536.1 uncharacterized protein Dwil_GK28318 [Drosophila willistoni]